MTRVRKVPWWEDQAYRESVAIPEPGQLLDFLVGRLPPEDLAAMLRVDVGQLSDWLSHPGTMSHDQDVRLRLVYRVVKTVFNYAGEEDGLTLLLRPYMDARPICTMLADDDDDRQLLRQVRQTLEKSWKLPPREPATLIDETIVEELDYEQRHR